jgi:hypothetical protein
MLTFIVTLLAKSGPLGLQQPVMLGSMREMAVQTVLAHRWMLPKERASFFCVARQAVFVDGSLSEEGGANAAMRIVAVGAGYFAFAHWHMRRPHELGAPELMTLEARFHFRRFGQ